ncbi:MAG: anthranilate phosphoribosyltransferase [Acidimicrobiia bacterium]|nr:anthranilate phosphoribosyltransferase [bacterium]MXX01828.1 anthranilate phosphoribosyltransferase [Acidimicrobiia bacterium]MXX46404.1 anthranilate phosphoribosyltransferase [Acidimicrobiia bacterium]MYB77877.1 anthranilate phosphoribosyltransferase [Acidimicrobiia bacterium]MYD42152.1 anthranilate phosphoribosyltransferase [Acidimicrobiia bacterium]
MNWSEILGKLTAGVDLSRSEARAALDDIMSGRATPAQTSAFLVSLRIKGETAEEMAGLVETMRAVGIRVSIGEPVVDTAGTGGDRSGTFNISTTAALIAAGAGAKVAKHGNRSASSKCGSADVLEALGVGIELDPEETAEMVTEAGFGFFFAPRYHPAMKYVVPIRRQLAIPTVFNFLGPLTNPAGATRQLIGVYDSRMAERMIGVLSRLGTERALVVHADDGLDEVSVSGPTRGFQLVDGEVTPVVLTPEDFGLDPADVSELIGGDAETNAGILRAVLAGETGPRRDAAVANAAATLMVAGLAESPAEGARSAARSIDSGAAAAVLDRVIKLSR